MPDADRQGRDRPWRNLYGRRHGKKLKPNQARLLESLLPRLAVPGVTPRDNPARLALAPLFPDDRPLWLEVGFGGGEHMVHQAATHPEVGIVGCEPFVNGVATALTHIRDQNLANVRLWNNDALDVLRRVPDGALSFLYLLHPDPWPKARHAKRRMVNDGPIDLFASKLKPGGEFRLATDDPTYLNWSLMIMQRHTDQFEWLAKRPKDFLEPSGGWIETRYGAKSRREGRRPYYLRYRRR